MNVETFGIILGIGTIILFVLTISIALMRILFGKESNIITIIGSYAFPIGFLLGFASITGSLIYSEIYNLPPCLLCWWQRIFIYPQVLFFALAWYRTEKGCNESNIFFYTLPLAIIGTITSLYHVILQRGVISSTGACVLSEVSCTTIDVQVFGFITIPVMAFVIGLALTLLGYIAIQNKKTA